MRSHVTSPTIRESRQDKVLHDGAAGGTVETDAGAALRAGQSRQMQERGQGRELVSYQDGIGGLQGQVAAVAAHRDAEVRGRERGGVVDAVPYDQYVLAEVTHGLHSLRLVLGQQRWRRPR